MDIQAETFMNKTSAYFLSLYYFYRANFRSVLSTSVREWRCSRSVNLTERKADYSVPVFVLKSQPYNRNNGFPQAKYHPLIIANMEIWRSKCGTYHHHLEVIFYFSLSLSSLFSSFPHQKRSRPEPDLMILIPGDSVEPLPSTRTSDPLNPNVFKLSV